MNTSYTLKTILTSLLLLLLVTVNNANGETHDNKLANRSSVISILKTVEQKENPTPLISVLEELKKNHAIEILYEEQNLKGKYVDYFKNENNRSVEKVLETILDNSGLRFEKIKTNTYAIVLIRTKPIPIISSTYYKVNSPTVYLASNADSQAQAVQQVLALNSIKKDRIISGNVISGADNIPLPGVNILIKGTTDGTITDIDGNYKIAVPDNTEALVFSFIGYLDQEVPIGTKSIINVVMASDITQLSEVVVTALGFKEEKDKLGYTSSKVDGAQIANSGEGNVINGMAGKASGVRITRSSGDPGAGSHIQIRGASTISGLQPLIILDGIPISNRGGGSTGGVVQQSRLNDINPDDIARVDVLKGASAAALWGTRAANGVIIITTKKGASKDKIDITFRSSYSVDKILRRYDLQTAYGQGSGGNFVQGDRRSWGDKIADRNGEADIFDESGAFFRANDGSVYYNILGKNSRDVFTDFNYDQIFQNGHFLDNSLSLSGGDENSNFFMSFSDFAQQGVVRENSDYRRTTFRINAERRFNKVVKIRSNTSYMRTNSNRIRRGNSSSGVIIPLLRTPADFDNSNFLGDYYPNASAAPIKDRQRAYRNPIGSSVNPRFNNPLWSIHRQQNEATVNRFITSAQINITPVNWLEFVLRGGIDTFTERRDSFFFPSSAGDDQSSGAFSDGISQRLEFNTDLMAIFKPELGGEFNGQVLAGFNFNNRKSFSVGGSINNFILPIELKDFNNAQRDFTNLSDSEGMTRIAAMYSSISLDYKDILFAAFTGRIESASTFGEESNNTFFYPSATLAWQFTKLSILQGSSIFSFGKLRAGYAEVGIEPGRYNTTSIYVSPNYSDPFGGSIDASLYGNGSFVPSAAIGNPRLTPEIKREIELGTDLRFFDHRFKVNLTYYYNRTTDILLDVPLPTSAGYDDIHDNAGIIENRGWEVDLSYNIIKSRDFNWSVGVLWDRNRNEVISLKGVSSINIGGISGRVVEGEQHGVLWGARWARNDNGSIRLGENGFPTLDNTDGVIGDPNPDWRGSIFTDLSYKNFSFNILFETFQGADIAAGTKGVLADYGITPETAIETIAPQDLLTYAGTIIPAGTSFRGSIEDFGAGQVALTEDWYLGEGGFFNGSFEQFIEDGSWTRIREVSLNYRLNSAKFRELSKLQSVEFSATGRNLFVWSTFEGNDPDTNLTGASTARGIEYFNTPGTQSYIFTIKINY